jgi:hypothetical protein
MWLGREMWLRKQCALPDLAGMTKQALRTHLGIAPVQARHVAAPGEVQHRPQRHLGAWKKQAEDRELIEPLQP